METRHPRNSVTHPGPALLISFGMLTAATGFVVVGFAILVGYIIGRFDLLGPHARPVLSRLVFFVLSPALLFVVLSQADVHALFSALLPVSAIAAVVVLLCYTVLAGVVWRRSLGEVVVGALSAGQVNANNIGIPISLYLLGSAAYPAPVILMQIVVLSPISFALLDIARSRTSSPWRVVARAVTNPAVVASLAGVLVSLTGVSLPSIVMDPLQLVADACIPLLLISYGISLRGQRILAASGRRRDVLLASTLKLIGMPAAAWAIGTVFGLHGEALTGVVVLAALPTAQNVFNYAQRYNIGETIARDTIFLTTVGCIPVLVLATLLVR